MPALLFPAALAALVALAIPLALHLARRSEAIPLDFAALQWLRDKPRPRARLRFDERLLLALRLALLALVALWLAHPVLRRGADTTPVIAVHPAADLAAGDLASPPGARRLWLAPGFPPTTTPPLGLTGATLASLVRQLDSELAPGVALHLVVPPVIVDADAERPRLSRRVTWQVAPRSSRALQAADTAATATARPLPRLRFLPTPAPGLATLRAAAAAWTPPGRPAAFDTAAALPTPPRVLVHLAPGPLPAATRAWIAAGGTALVGSETPPEPGPVTVLWRDTIAAPVVEARNLGRGRLLRFTRPLTPAAFPDLLDPSFPTNLAHLLTPPAPAPARVAARDLAPTTGAPPWPRPARDLQPWLAVALALLFLVERWFATRRMRGAAA